MGEEFECHIKDDSVQAVLMALELEPSDAWALFRLLDADGSVTLDAEEFVEGCLQLRGNARSIDLAKQAYDLKNMKRQQQVFMVFVEEQFAELRGQLERALV